MISKSAKGSDSKKVLILDDDPEYMAWVYEYLESLDLHPVISRSVDDGLIQLSKEDYRFLLVDMNVPASDGLIATWIDKQPLCKRYPGLILAHEARNRGYGAHSVIGYTVHDDSAAAAELQGKLHCRYVLKGRPQTFKSVVQKTLAPKPS